MAERTLAVRRQEAENCHRLIEQHVLDFQRPQQEFVVCGFTEGKGSRKHFGALLLGAYRDGRLRYFDQSGTGFSEKELAEAIDRLRPFFTNKPPVQNQSGFGVSSFKVSVLATHG